MVPASVRGEAMGWHGSFMTAGGATGAPVAGLAIDRAGAGAGFVAVAVVGLVVAVLGIGGVDGRAPRTRRGRLLARRRVWQTASTLLPSGSRTKPPK